MIRYHKKDASMNLSVRYDHVRRMADDKLFQKYILYYNCRHNNGKTAEEMNKRSERII